MCSYLGWCVGAGWVSNICVGSLGELLCRGIGYISFGGRVSHSIHFWNSYWKFFLFKILLSLSTLILFFVFLMLSTITVFHFLGPIWCLSICSWTGNIGAYKWVMYRDLPLEQHYLIKDRASLHCFTLSLFSLSLCLESLLFHFIIFYL